MSRYRTGVEAIAAGEKELPAAGVLYGRVVSSME
jgi:hypothetical protein